MTPNKLHCPNCKSHNITITTESSVTGGLTTHHGGVSSTHMSNNHRNFWICSDCGTKFRNIQNLEEEIHKNRHTPLILFILAGLCAALTLWLLIEISGSTFGFFLLGPFAAGSAIGAIVCTIGGFVTKGQRKKALLELEYLKYHCFN